MTKLTHDPDRHLEEELRIIIQIFDNSHATGDPLTASEFLVQIPRKKFERICRLALKYLQQPHLYAFGPISTTTIDRKTGEFIHTEEYPSEYSVTEVNPK